MSTVNDVLTVARSQLGYFVPGPPRYSKYGAWMGMNPNPYCDMFVSWVFDQAGLGGYFGKQSYCPASVTFWKNKGRLFSTPQAGDQVIYFWNGVYAHTGIVESVDGANIITIEGNTSGSGSQANGGAVVRKIRPWQGNGTVFGRPIYAAVQPPAVPTTPQFDPPQHIDAVSGEGRVGGVGGWILQKDGAIFSYDAPYLGGANGQPYFVPREAKQLVAKDNGGYVIIATDSSGDPPNGYDYPGGGNRVHLGPVFNPSVSLNIVAFLSSPAGGFWVLLSDGAIFTFGNASYHGGANGQSYFVGRKPARLEPHGDGYDIIATSGERYQFPN